MSDYEELVGVTHRIWCGNLRHISLDFKERYSHLSGEEIGAPVSRVSSPIRCEYNSLKSRDICLKLPLHLLRVTPTNSSQSDNL